MLEAAIFDMDGVLSDSESFYEASVDAVMDRFGIDVPQDFKLLLHGMPTRKTWEIVSDRYSPPATVEELVAMEQDFIDGRINSGVIPPVPFAFPFMQSLKEKGLKIAVATSNFRYRALKVIEQNNVETLVDVLVGAEDVINNKPAPDLFLLAASRLGVEPGNCIVIEDSPYGIEAARAAGMVAVLYAHPERAQYPGLGADLVLSTFENMTLESIEALI